MSIDSAKTFVELPQPYRLELSTSRIVHQTSRGTALTLTLTLTLTVTDVYSCSLLYHFIDLSTIRSLVLSEKLNPLFLDASNFCVVENANRVIACAQVREIDSDNAELASVVVERKFRRRGLGAVVIKAAMEAAVERGVDPRNVYLLTVLRKRGLYNKSGFKVIETADAPSLMRVEAMVGSVIVKLLDAGELCAMRFDSKEEYTPGVEDD